MDEWLSKLSGDQRILDLGSGSGSFDYSKYICPIIALDNDIHSLSRIPATRPAVFAVNSDSRNLPFKDRTFSLVLCNNTLEHFPDASLTLSEIGRILAPDGMLVIIIPNGYGFDDNLYRYLMEGGGHVNRFSFDQIVGLVEGLAGIRLVKWQELYSSFVYLKKPLPAVLKHLRPRFRRIARLPAWLFRATQLTLNVLVRCTARLAGPEIALYGWALYFRRNNEPLAQTPARINVCMGCGAGLDAASLGDGRLARFFYRCPCCKELNPYFKPRGMTV